MNNVTMRYPGPCTVCGATAEGWADAVPHGNWNTIPHWECRCRAHGASPLMTCLPVEDLDALKAEVGRLTALAEVACRYSDRRTAYMDATKTQHNLAQFVPLWDASIVASDDLRVAVDAYRAAKEGVTHAAHD